VPWSMHSDGVSTSVVLQHQHFLQYWL